MHPAHLLEVPNGWSVTREPHQQLQSAIRPECFRATAPIKAAEWQNTLMPLKSAVDCPGSSDLHITLPVSMTDHFFLLLIAFIHILLAAAV